jgi:hypothetical protein
VGTSLALAASPFVSATDLHVAVPAGLALNAAGAPITDVTTDFDGDTRSTTRPDIGADEFTANLDVSVAALTAPVASSTCFGTTETVTANITNASTAALDFSVTPVTVTVTITPTTGTAQTFTTVLNTGTLAAGASRTVAFTNTANLSVVGTYTATVTTLLVGDDNPTNNALTPVTITSGSRSAAFTYPTATICAGATGTVAATLGTGATAGTFTSTTGLTINATTGVITPATSTAGTYVVTNTLPATATCPALTTTQSVTITAAPVATISYPAATTGNCAGSTGTVAATLGTGATAGTFTSTTGLTINATTGAVNLATSTAGTYTVTNTVANAGGCTTTATATFTVNPTPVRPTLTATYTATTATLTSSAATGNQFYLGGVLIPGATGTTYVVNGGTPAQLGSYTVVVTNSFGCSSAASLPLIVTGTKNSIAGASVLVYPNPTPNGRMTVELSGFRVATQLTVFDAMGRVVTSELLPANSGITTHAIDLSKVASGIYTLRLTNTDGVETRRLVRE